MNRFFCWCIFGFLLFKANLAFCCTCMKLTPQEAFQSADAVFKGEVTAIESIQVPQEEKDSAGNPILYTKVITYLKVTDVWKGIETPTAVIASISNSTCHYSFQNHIPVPYLVYAHRSSNSDTLTTSICQLTKFFPSAESSSELDQWAPQEKAEDADFDSNGIVDFHDFLLLVSAFETQDSRFDLFRDGQVNFPDFLKFAKWFGQAVSEN